MTTIENDCIEVLVGKVQAVLCDKGGVEQYMYARSALRVSHDRVTEYRFVLENNVPTMSVEEIISRVSPKPDHIIVLNDGEGIVHVCYGENDG